MIFEYTTYKREIPYRRAFWKRILTNDTLFQDLGKAIRNGGENWDQLANDAREWRNAYRCMSEPSPAQLNEARDLQSCGALGDRWTARGVTNAEIAKYLDQQAQTLLDLVRCARLAAICPERFQDQFDEAETFQDLTDRPELDPKQIWVWARTFLGAAVLSSATVDFAVAEANGKGHVYQLKCEVVEGGVQGVFLHPASAMTTWLDDSFKKAIEIGWDAARQTCDDQKRIKGFGRYQILKDGKPFEGRIHGDSAGGAAFLGWARALTKTVPDDRIIVLAKIEKDDANGFKLAPVGELKAKTAAIRDLNRHDTIAVAGNADEVANLLNDQIFNIVDLFARP